MQPDFYAILALPRPPAVLTAQVVKKAYHAALLRHHPDKASQKPVAADAPSVDVLGLAYKTLSTPALRTEYNAGLDNVLAGASDARTPVSNGSEVVQTVDLDEFAYNEAEGCYVLACRCGEAEGFVLTEEELESAAEGGVGSEREVVVGCGGCSLWWRVAFEVVDED